MCVCVCVVSVCACGWRMRVVGLTWSSSMRSWSSGGYPRSCFNPLCRYGEAGIEEEEDRFAGWLTASAMCWRVFLNPHSLMFGRGQGVLNRVKS